MNEYIKEIEEIAEKCTISQSDGYSQIMRICEAMKEEHKQYIEWLEELKAYRASVFSGDMTQKMLKEEYCKAVDDFAKKFIVLSDDGEFMTRLSEFPATTILELAERLKVVNRMSRDKAETIAYAIRKECQKDSLYEWCESWDITIDEFEEFLSNGIKESESE